MKVLLSIKPEFVKNMQQGDKKFEFRKTIFRESDVTSVVVYATKPLGKVVGEFEIQNILEGTPDAIWEKTKEFSGISKKFFKNYFAGKNSAYAIQLDKFIEYKEPVNLQDFAPQIKNPPQSFCYLR